MRPLRTRLHEIIFEADTPAGKGFDIVLILLILLSVAAVLLDSVETVRIRFGQILSFVEWTVTLLFSVEYGLRLYSVTRPMRYAFSFFGVIDLLSVLPTYISLFIPGSHYLMVVRVLRVLRVFRVLKLAQYLVEAKMLTQAVRASRRKIFVFLLTVMILVVLLGALMYIVEGGENGFTSIPKSIYWAIVTLTTVGYGDISPKTPFGQTLASLIMILGFGIIAIPTGIVTAEITAGANRKISTQSCPACSRDGHDPDAIFCKFCGTRL